MAAARAAADRTLNATETVALAAALVVIVVAPNGDATYERVLAVGHRRTAGTTQLYRLDEVWTRSTLDRVLECYRRTAELDDGGLGRLLASFVTL